MKRNCLNCGKEFEAMTVRKKFDTPSCKLMYNRNNKAGRTVSHETVTPANDTITSQNDTVTHDTERIVSPTEETRTFTKTDRLFQDDAIKRRLGADWLAFSDIVRQADCIHCKKTFKTRLPLLRYCSPEHRSTDLSTFTL